MDETTATRSDGTEPAPTPNDAAEPAPTTLTAAGSTAVATTALPRASRGRWIAAGLVVIAVALGTIAAFVFLGAKPLPEALRYVPVDSAVVAELRPELPGDQRQHVGNFLAHFPGFADQSILSAKIDEALDRIVDAASDGSVDYGRQLKPILAGPMTLSMGSPDVADAAAGDRPSGLLLVATTDGKARCDTVFDRTSPGTTHRAVQITVISITLSCALDGRFMLLGSEAAIVAGIDARQDGKAIDGSSTFRSARDQIVGDQLALLFVNGEDMTSALASLAPSAGIDASLGGALPAWAIAGLRVVDDALQVETITPPVAEVALASGTPTDPPPAKSHFASILPADALGFVEVHGTGANLERLLARLKADPAQAESVTALEEALASVGGIASVASWIEDLGIAGVPVGDSPGAVVLLRGTDDAATKARFDGIRNLLLLASVGSDITIETSDHGGVTITNVDVGELGPMFEALGVPLPSLPSGTRIRFSLANRDDVVLVGIGDGVLERVLDVEAGASLASSAGYGRAIGLATSPNDIEAYVAVDAIAAWVEKALPASTDLEAYRRDFKPYLEHLAGLVSSTVTTSTGTRTRIILTVK